MYLRDTIAIKELIMWDILNSILTYGRKGFI